MKNTDYMLTTYADGYSVWHCRIDFPYGAGNTGEGERLIENARAAARRAIRREIESRGNGDKVPALRFKIVANKENPSSGALLSLTIAEDGVIEHPEALQRLTFDFARRGNSSYYGNPSWTVWFKELGYGVRTSSNAAWSYEVAGIKSGTVLDVSMTRAGRIAFARKVR